MKKTRFILRINRQERQWLIDKSDSIGCSAAAVVRALIHKFTTGEIELGEKELADAHGRHNSGG